MRMWMKILYECEYALMGNPNKMLSFKNKDPSFSPRKDKSNMSVCSACEKQLCTIEMQFCNLEYTFHGRFATI